MNLDAQKAHLRGGAVELVKSDGNNYISITRDVKVRRLRAKISMTTRGIASASSAFYEG